MASLLISSLPLLLVWLIAAPVSAQVLSNNSTINLPPGTTNHGDTHLLCTPTTWTDIVTFFFGNYIAHAATIVPLPGSSYAEIAKSIVVALLFPVSGIHRGFRALCSLSIFCRSDLSMAANAGALCQVIRSTEDARRYERALNSANWWRRVKIHGRAILPPAYQLAVTPRGAKFKDCPDSPITLGSDYNCVRIILSVVQLVFAITTLYRSRGDQIDQYGYAAFGLTVIQYALMSFINLVGNLVCPNYPALYLVNSKIMEEAKREGAIFEGVVGTLDENEADPDRDPFGLSHRQLKLETNNELLQISMIPLCISIAVIGAMSHFKAGQSTTVERVFTMTWLIFGGAFHGGLYRLPAYNHSEPEWGEVAGYKLGPGFVIEYFGYLVYAAIGAVPGFCVVGKMLKEYGTCTYI